MHKLVKKRAGQQFCKAQKRGKKNLIKKLRNERSWKICLHRNQNYKFNLRQFLPRKEIYNWGNFLKRNCGAASVGDYSR